MYSLIPKNFPFSSRLLTFFNNLPQNNLSLANFAPILYILNVSPVFELPGGWGLNPLPHLADPLPLVKIRPRGVEFQPPHLSFAKVAMLLDSHFLLMQFLKCLLFYSVMI